jgi:hypothetical protein
MQVVKLTFLNYLQITTCATLQITKKKTLKGICWPSPSQGHLQSYTILATSSFNIVLKSTIDDDNTMLEQICWV